MKLNKLFILSFSSILLTAVTSAEEGKKKGPKGPKPAPKAFDVVDTDKDGKISLVEFSANAKNAEKAKERFTKKDADADGFLSKEEYAKTKGKGGPKKGPKKEKKPA